MGESAIRDVDRLAAANILSELGLTPDSARIDAVARHLAAHRQTAQVWAVGQARDRIVARLEAATIDRSQRESEDWVRGLGEAEHQVVVMQPHELLGEVATAPRTRGTILRSMVRQARSVPR